MADDWPDLWRSWQHPDAFAHPDSPSGGSGTGSSRPPGFRSHSTTFSGIPHPDSPAGRGFDWQKDLPRIHIEESITSALREIDRAVSLNGLNRAAQVLLGAKSFDLGVCYGLAEKGVDMAGALLSLAKTFVLAGLYDAAHMSPWSVPTMLPLYVQAKAIEMFFGEALKKAHEQRDELIRELIKAISSPIELLSGLAKNVADEYTAKWKRLQQLMAQPTLSANFEAGRICGGVLFDVLILITTIGDIARAAKFLAEVPQLVRAAKGLKEFAAAAGKATGGETGAARLGTAAEDARAARASAGSGSAVEAPRVESPKPASAPKKALTPGSAEHKAARWQEYQARGGKWDYERWSKQYEVNMQNPRVGLAREQAYREAMGGENVIVETPRTNRQIDIFKAEDDYMGQVKTGKEYLTRDNIEAIKKDATLVEQGYKVEYILEKGASEPFLEALRDAGISYKIGPQIP